MTLFLQKTVSFIQQSQQQTQQTHNCTRLDSRHFLGQEPPAAKLSSLRKEVVSQLAQG